MGKLTVLGEVVVDRIYQESAYTDVAGGSAANCALALTKIGQDVKFKARFSEDKNGEFLINAAKSNKLDLTQSIRTTDPATVVNVKVDRAGVPQYEFLMEGTADWNWTETELSGQNLADQDALIYGSLVAILSPGYLAIQNWISTNRQTHLLVAYDPNARPSALPIKDHDIYRERIISLIKEADVVKVSDEDLAWIAPNQDPEKVVAIWSQMGPQLVVLTRGANGANAYRDGVCIAQVPGSKVNVIDTVGAGDTLMAWLISGLVDTPESQRYQANQVESILKKAVAAAAITCSRAGCNPPSLNEMS